MTIICIKTDIWHMGGYPACLGGMSRTRAYTQYCNIQCVPLGVAVRVKWVLVL